MHIGVLPAYMAVYHHMPEMDIGSSGSGITDGHKVEMESRSSGKAVSALCGKK